ncbi:probable polygalacturonase At1g80170 isoform X1 [Cucumis melo]|uniref:Probable polygalacturonase At1g80170 isoform X1 n=1 Tax=Cucumis melo TaxID=3656 RepID=A0ABM3LAU4_CUCME|nr:probable polygalacturonase At1g80170 isoform X1 [Cucumis melo]
MPTKMASLFSFINSNLFLSIIALIQITLVISSNNSTEMDKLFLLSLLGLLIIAYGVSGTFVSDSDIDMIEELESFDIEEEDDDVVYSYTVPAWRSERGSKILMNVDSFDAVGDGVTDDTMAFRKAWETACSTSKSVLLVPKEKRYLVNATTFKGPCKDGMVIQIEGTIVAPDEPELWDPKFPRQWLEFTKLNAATFQGDGVIDGSGEKWWAESCKKNKSRPCKGAPTAFTIDSSSNIRVKGLTIQNSQQMHFTIARSETVRITEVRVSAPGDSPNTDGIHITQSTNVVVQNSKISTGDDCISIVNASSGIKMKGISCGPGHGISIGSLGKDNSTGIVTKVVLDTAFLRETTNGVRIKTWQVLYSLKIQNLASNQTVTSNIRPYSRTVCSLFIIEFNAFCFCQTSAVKISQIMYRNISGTTTSKNAMKFACSDSVPCSNIILSNVNLEKTDGTVETYCHAAQGFGYGIVHPSADCLTSSDNNFAASDQTQVLELETVQLPTEQHIVHTEL